MLYRFHTALLAALVVLGCTEEPKKVVFPASKKCGSQSGPAKNSKSDSIALSRDSILNLQDDQDAQNLQVTFYQDILPVLTANERGRNFKCATCHAHYLEPEGLNNVPETERIIASLKAGRMPRSNDRVPDRDIDLFETWRLQGFADGDKSQGPRARETLPEDNDNSAGQDSGNTDSGKDDCVKDRKQQADS